MIEYRVDRVRPPWQVPYYELYSLHTGPVSTLRELESVHLFRTAAVKAWRAKVYGVKPKVRRERIV